MTLIFWLESIPRQQCHLLLVVLHEIIITTHGDILYLIQNFQQNHILEETKKKTSLFKMKTVADQSCDDYLSLCIDYLFSRTSQWDSTEVTHIYTHTQTYTQDHILTHTHITELKRTEQQIWRERKI